MENVKKMPQDIVGCKEPPQWGILLGTWAAWHQKLQRLERTDAGIHPQTYYWPGFARTSRRLVITSTSWSRTPIAQESSCSIWESHSTGNHWAPSQNSHTSKGRELVCTVFQCWRQGIHKSSCRQCGSIVLAFFVISECLWCLHVFNVEILAATRTP